MVDLAWGIGIAPCLEWKLLDVVSFKSEPGINFSMKLFNGGLPEAATYENESLNDIYTITSVTVPVGAVYSPTEWVEVRAGVNYNVCFYTSAWDGWKGTYPQDRKLTDSINQYFNYNLGVGFAIAEDFLIDFAVSGSDYVNLMYPTLQFTYKW